MGTQANDLLCAISENITREVDKTGNLTFLPLEAGAAFWTETIANMPLPEDRKAVSGEVIRKIKVCGYDIYTEAVKLKEHYLQAIKERKKCL